MSRILIACLLALLLPLSLAAQQRPNTILVMDGSGSMWGQIDGVNKIVIAREVVAEVLGDFPEDQNLGLTVYGHRTRGDCSDIETVIAPATGTAGQIVDVVNAINPRGRTPMTDAIIAAAEALRYTEGKGHRRARLRRDRDLQPRPLRRHGARWNRPASTSPPMSSASMWAPTPEALAQMQCIAEEDGAAPSPPPPTPAS